MQMNGDVLVKVEGVSKKFCRNLKRSLWYGVKDIASEMTGRTVDHDTLRKDEFWAVTDVSFELRRGECLGLIGHNGAGKSTLLKILNGLIKPDSGKITMKGRIGALIELGAGFNPILTGRENIFVNGQILGFSKKEISEKFDTIIEFAEIGDFIDTPVQNYSSGMKVRLGFAVAAQMEPDVLLIDEVLAVGDIGFRVKCFNKINELIENCAVILVSHSMPNIGRLASRTILMKNGIINIDSENSRDAIEAYYSNFKTEDKVIISKHLKYDKIEFSNQIEKKVKFGNNLIFTLSFYSELSIKETIVGIAIMDQSLRTVGAFRSKIGHVNKGRNEITFCIDKLRFSGVTYYFSIEINRFENGLKKEVVALFKNVENFTITNHPFELDSVVYLDGEVKFND